MNTITNNNDNFHGLLSGQIIFDVNTQRYIKYIGFTSISASISTASLSFATP